MRFTDGLFGWAYNTSLASSPSLKLTFYYFNVVNNVSVNFSTCPIDVVAVMIAKGLHYFNSVLNPIIYSLMNQQFKTAFKHLFYLTFNSLSGTGPQINRAEIEKQLSTSTRFSSLKSRSSTQEKNTCTKHVLNTSSQKV